MRVYYMSDLHMGAGMNRQYVKSMDMVGGKDDVLVLAGDIFLIHENENVMRDNIDLVDWYIENLSETYRQVVIVPGNHEFYGHADILKFGDSWEYKLRDNVAYYQNRVVRIDDTDFILTTLWSHIDDNNRNAVKYGMNDFRLILYGGRLFDTKDFDLEHEKCVEFIRKSIEASTADHIVVVTHHVPVKDAVSEVYKGNPLNSAFNADLEKLIDGSRIDYWVYGHSHFNMDMEIGNTKIVTNQLGYVSGGEPNRNGFKNGRFFEI